MRKASRFRHVRIQAAKAQDTFSEIAVDFRLLKQSARNSSSHLRYLERVRHPIVSQRL
jgi:hypothetical protein